MAVFRKREEWWIGYRGGDGQWHREHVGPSKTQAKDRLSQRKTEANEGRWFPSRATQGLTFQDLKDHVWKTHAPTFRSKSWGSMVKELEEVLGPKQAAAITSAHVQDLYNAIMRRASASTANRKLTLVNLIFNRARRDKIFHGPNPCEGVKKNPEAGHRTRWLTEPEMCALLDACSQRLRPFVEAALLSGCRRGELLGLTWDGVDLMRGVLALPMTKTGRPQEVPLSPKLREVLEVLPRREGSVFGLTPGTLRKDWDAAVKAARLPVKGPGKVTIHVLRHSFGTWFAMKGGSLYSLQIILRHSDSKLTRRYANVGTDYLAAEMARTQAEIPLEIAPKVAPTFAAELGYAGKVL